MIHCKAVGEGMPLDPSLTLKRSFIMLPMRKCFVSLLSAAFALAGYAAFETATYYVDAASGDDANDGSSPEKAKATIQAMYNAATADATIWVFPGAYSNDVGRGADSTHWWGRSRLHLGQKSMRIVSTGGAAVTHIVGKLGHCSRCGSGQAIRPSPTNTPRSSWRSRNRQARTPSDRSGCHPSRGQHRPNREGRR